MMIASDLARFAVVGVLAVFDATGNPHVRALLVLTFLNGLGDGFFFPAVGGIVPLVVEQARASVGEQPDRRRALGPR
jgi:hypothetical protein